MKQAEKEEGKKQMGSQIPALPDRTISASREGVTGRGEEPSLEYSSGALRILPHDTVQGAEALPHDKVQGRWGAFPMMFIGALRRLPLWLSRGRWGSFPIRQFRGAEGSSPIIQSVGPEGLPYETVQGPWGAFPRDSSGELRILPLWYKVQGRWGLPYEIVQGRWGASPITQFRCWGPLCDNQGAEEPSLMSWSSGAEAPSPMRQFRALRSLPL